MEEAKWYVVHTYSGYEQKVCTTLAKMVENRHMQDLILETKIPTELVTEIKDNTKREVEQKLFPG
ncbi:MAG: transcription termination/antitermination protein NusG, partial [Clostridia bacterium]|nr:transcription termination/antitermination protein NusG [Clostridia bacterium]